MTLTDAVLAGASILLSLTFLISGIAKLFDLSGTRSALISLQIPARALHPLFAVLTPVLEIAIAAAVWIPVWRLPVIASALALVMMVVFTVVIARALRFEDAVHCSCFGTLGSPTVTTGTLARNILLGLVALTSLLAALNGISAGALGAADPLAALALTLVLAVAAALAVLIRGGTDRLAGENGASPGTAAAAHSSTTRTDAGANLDAHAQEESGEYLRMPIPFAELNQPSGAAITLRDLAREQAVLLVSLSVGCGPCARLMPKIPAWRDALAPFVQVKPVFANPPGGLPDDVLESVNGDYLLDPERRTMWLMEMTGTPSAVLLGADQLVAGGPVAGRIEIEEFVDEIQAQLAEAAELHESAEAQRINAERGGIS